MSVSLAPIAPRYAVSNADDPFKKYWWLILIGIGLTAMWLLMPMMGEQSVGSTVASTEKPKTDVAVEQSFGKDDSGMDLSMDGAIHKKKADQGLTGSMLFQAAPGDGLAGDAPAAGAAAAGPVSASTGKSLSAELAKVSKETGWAEKAQKGFTAPKLSGNGLSGMGSAGGGHSGSAGGSGAFGSKNANIGFGSTKALTDKPDAVAASKGLGALQAAAKAAQSAAGNRSNDGAASSLKAAFDGSKGSNNNIAAGGAALNGAYEALDTAPVNLKLSDPKLNEKKLEAPPGTDVGQTDMKDSEFAKQLAMQMVGIVIGGAIGGVAGGIVTQVITQAIQRQQDQQEKVRQLEEKQQLDAAKARVGGGH